MHLVMGASGAAGSAVVRKLLERGERVRAVSRDPARLEAARARGAETVRGDLLANGWLEPALDGIEVLVIASQGLYPPSLRNNPDRCDRRGVPRLLDAAKGAGVRHVVFLSADAAAPDALTLWGRLKYELEVRLRDSGIPHTIVRPTVFMENHILVMMAEPLRAGGTVRVIGSGAAPLNWISAADVAEYIVVDILETGPLDQVVRLAGRQVMSRLEVLDLLESRLGRRARRSHLAPGVIRAMRTVLGPVHPGLRYLLDLALAEEEGVGAGTADPESAPSWYGDTTIEAVIDRWAAA